MATSNKGMVVYGRPDLFATDMRKIINEEDYSDITFLVGEDRVKMFAHKVILGARCEVFRAMFVEQRHAKKSEKSAKEAPLVLPDVRPTVFQTVLEFIYTNGCKLTQSTVVDVLASAIEYGLEGLAECCVQYITTGLKVDTACEAIQAAITYQQEELRDTCMAFIEENTMAIFKSPHFVEISDNTFCHILQSDNLSADENAILLAVKDWGTVNAVVAGKSVAEVLKQVVEHIRYPLLSHEVLQKLEADNEKDAIIPVRLISKAWKYHATKHADKSDPQFRPRQGTVL